MEQNEYEKAAEDYNPRKKNLTIKCLLVAESPPPKGYFYYTSGSDKIPDNLFENVMLVLFKEDYEKLENNQLKKTDLLGKFRDKGFFLIDVYRRPKNLVFKSPSEIKENEETLPRRIGFLTPEKVVLIGITLVYYRQGKKLKEEGINVINTEPIPLPMHSNENKERFRQEFRKVLEKNGLLPSGIK